MAVTHQNHKVSSLSLSEEVISHPQAEGLKAGATINVLAAAFLSGHLEGSLQLWILQRYLMAERQQARLR